MHVYRVNRVCDISAIFVRSNKMACQVTAFDRNNDYSIATCVLYEEMNGNTFKVAFALPIALIIKQ